MRNFINYGLCDNYRLFTDKIKMHTFWHQWEGRHWSCGGLWSWDGVGFCEGDTRKGGTIFEM